MPTISCYVSNQLADRLDRRVKEENITRNKFLVVALLEALDVFDGKVSNSLGSTTEEALRNCRVDGTPYDSRIQKIREERKHYEGK